MIERKWMARPLVASCVGLILIAGMASPGSGSAGESDPPGGLWRGEEGAEYVLLTEEEVHQDTVRALMELSGWTAEEVEWSLVRDNAAGAISEGIARNRPGVYIGFSVSTTDPYEPPKIFVKGVADPFIRRLVGESAVRVELVDNQPFSLVELEARSSEVHAALRGAGYSSVSTGFALAGGGEIEAIVMREPGLGGGAEGARRRLPETVRSHVSIKVSAGPVSEDHAISLTARGGMPIGNTTEHKCTAGFSITANGINAVMSAGHCLNSLTRLYLPRNNSYGPLGSSIGISHVADHTGAYGDFGYYIMNPTSNAEATFIRSYTSGNFNLTGVTGVLSGSYLGEGKPVCFWSRKRVEASGGTDPGQRCGYVLRSSFTCRAAGAATPTLERMVVIDRALSSPGDSGAAMYLESKVAGVVKGSCKAGGVEDGKEAFSRADLMHLAFPNVTIVVKTR